MSQAEVWTWLMKHPGWHNAPAIADALQANISVVYCSLRHLLKHGVVEKRKAEKSRNEYRLRG